MLFLKPSRVDHIGIAVPNLEEAVKLYEALGLEPQGYETVDEQKAKVAFFPLGDSELELLESTTPDGPIGKFVEKNGGKGGLHHIALRVDNIKEAIANMQEKGFQMIDKEPRYGAGNTSIAFVHPKSSGGILLELTQRN